MTTKKLTGTPVPEDVLQKVCFRQPRKRAKSWIVVLRIQDRPAGSEHYLNGSEILKEVKDDLGNLSSGLSIKSSSCYEIKDRRTDGRRKV
jgi:hypothetical protein